MKTIQRLISIFMTLILISTVAIAAQPTTTTTTTTITQISTVTAIPTGTNAVIPVVATRDNKPIIINSLEEFNKLDYYNLGFNYWQTILQVTTYRNKISLKEVEQGKGQIVNILNPFSTYLPDSGNHHTVWSSPSTLNIYLHPNSQFNKYVTIDALIHNKRYVINAYGVTYLSKSYGKEISEITCTKGGLVYRLLPKWIFDKYDKIAHFSDCTQPLNLDYYINLKEKK